MASKAKATYNLKVSPQHAADAIALLAQYVKERWDLVDQGKLTTAKEAIVMQRTIEVFAKSVGDQVKSPAEVLYNRLRFTTVPSKMEDEGIATIGIEGVGKVHLQDDISVKVEDKVALNDWLTDNGLEDLITETVNAQTLAASMRKRMAENAERVKNMQGVNIDPKDLLAMPPKEVCTITPVVRAVIKQ